MTRGQSWNDTSPSAPPPTARATMLRRAAELFTSAHRTSAGEGTKAFAPGDKILAVIGAGANSTQTFATEHLLGGTVVALTVRGRRGGLVMFAHFRPGEDPHVSARVVSELMANQIPTGATISGLIAVPAAETRALGGWAPTSQDAGTTLHQAIAAIAPDANVAYRGYVVDGSRDGELPFVSVYVPPAGNWVIAAEGGCQFSHSAPSHVIAAER